jgi:uncharacterized protein YcfJ
MKRISVLASVTLAALVSAGFATSASAGNKMGHKHHKYGDLADVISSTPIYDRIATPRRECYTEQVVSYEERRHVRRVHDDRYDQRYDNRGGVGPGTVLGAVIGGAIGRQFGNSSGGRDRGTAAGAIIGGVIGNDIERNGRHYNDGYQRASDVVEVERVPVTRNVERCRTVSDYRDQIVGYDVTYRYQGRIYQTRTTYDPGQSIPVDVNVRPADEYRQPYGHPQQGPVQYTPVQYSQPRPVYSRTY